MDKKTVIKKAREYVAYCKGIPDQILEMNQQITDNKKMMSLITVNVSCLESKGTAADNNSPVSGAVVKRERLKKDNKNIAAQIKKLEKEYADFGHFLRWLLINGTGTYYMNVLYDRYYEGLSLTALCSSYRCSRQYIGQQENKELLTLANVVLDIKADGEYYDDNGVYLDYTEKTKQKIRDWIKRLNDDPVVSMAY